MGRSLAKDSICRFRHSREITLTKNRAQAAFISVLLVYAGIVKADALTPQNLFEKVSPSVVIVKAENLSGKPIGQGSGVVVKSNEVATNCHVVRSAERLRVQHEGKLYAAAVKFADSERDLCLLEIANLPAKPVHLGEAKALKVGDSVFAIGSPQGLELSLSTGIVAQLRKGKGSQTPIIQTTAAISPGSSGGGLFDANGRLVGITTLYLADSQNLNFALPAEWIVELPARQWVVVEEAHVPAASPEVESESVRTAKFFIGLYEQVPNWRRYHDDKQFAAWLSETDAENAETRKQKMNRLADNYDLAGLVREYKAWENRSSSSFDLVAESLEIRFFMDKSQIYEQNGFVMAWETKDYKTSRYDDVRQTRYFSAKILSAYDCSSRTAAIASYVYYADKMGGGETLRSYDGPRHTWDFKPIVPDSVGASKFGYVCRKQLR